MKPLFSLAALDPLNLGFRRDESLVHLLISGTASFSLLVARVSAEFRVCLGFRELLPCV